MKPHTRLERELRRAAVLVATGVVIAALSLMWIHPLAFLAFVFLGCGLSAAGCILYLVALVRFPEEHA